MAHRTARIVVVAAAVLALLAPAVSASGGNSANAKLCQKDGWQAVETDSGATFVNGEACTSYAAGGGALFKPIVSAALFECVGISPEPPYALYVFKLSGFHANSIVSFSRPGDAFPLFTTTTDVTGSAMSPGAVVYSEGPASMSVSDAQGVHAATDFTATCSG